MLADADEHAVARGPGAGDRVGAHVNEHLLVDPLRRAPERQLAQRGQVSGLEIVAQRPLGLGRDIDLALVQPLDQVVGRDIHHLDVVGAIENPVGHRLANADMGDLRHDVVEAFDVLDVERRIDVDAGGQQLLDVEIALGVAAAGDVGMGELVDEDEGRLARQDRVEVHLLEDTLAVLDAAAGNDFDPFEQGLGLDAAVGLDDAGDDIDALAPRHPRGGEHLVGLANARRRAQEDLEPALALPTRLAEKRLRRGTLIAVRGIGAGHRPP